MALVPLRVVLDHAAENDYGVAAFNVNNMEQIQAIMEAAEATDSPVIIQASRGARAYSQDAYLRHLMLAAVELYPHIPTVMHQDHGNSPETCLSAIENGFTSVMMDGSLEEDGKTPADYDYNVRVTAEVVKMAHARGVSVEGELGCLGSLESGEGEQEDGHGAVGELTHDQLLTDPDEAARFVEETGVDALAVAIGTSHGAYKFTKKPTGEVLAMDRIEAIHAKLPNTHLVMHGSSSVPQELAGHHQQVWWPDEANLRCSGRRDPTRHQEWRAQDQRRHRLPNGDHRCDPKGLCRRSLGIRSPRLLEAGPRGDEASLRRAHDRLWASRKRCQIA